MTTFDFWLTNHFQTVISLNGNEYVLEIKEANQFYRRFGKMVKRANINYWRLKKGLPVTPVPPVQRPMTPEELRAMAAEQERKSTHHD